MYGIGNPAVAPAPPVPQVSASRAVIFPSADTPALIFDVADGRLPVARCSSLRSSISLTGAFAALASFAQIRPSAPTLSALLPKPPPIYWQITRTLACGIPSAPAKFSRAPLTPCVETHAVSLSPLHSHTVPCVSRHVWVITCVEYVSSSVC